MKALNSLAKEGKINENASVKDGHSIIINSPIDKVWGILIDLEKWTEWNPNIKNVVLSDSVDVGKDFKWILDGSKISSQIQSISAPNSLTWTGKSKWVKSIFVWQLEADDNQTIATLNASMQGAFTILVNNHQKIYRDLMEWLESLKQKAEA